MFSASSSRRAACSTTAWPAAVTRVTFLPSRSNIWKPSSSSSSLTCLLMPGCEVCSARAAAVMFRPFWTIVTS